MPERFKLTPRTLACPSMPMPTIDGRIDPQEWAAATHFAAFTRADGNAAPTKTNAWIGHDRGYLYLAVRCNEKDTAALSRHCTPQNSRGGLAGDRVEVLLDPGHNHVGVRMFQFGPFDQMLASEGSVTIGFRDGPDTRWIHHKLADTLANYCRSATHVEDGEYWSVEIAIPFESLGAAPPARGMVWGINVLRYTVWPVFRGPGREETAALSRWPNHDLYHPTVFADLAFDADQPVALAELDLGVPHFGENRNVIRFTAPADTEPLVAACSVRAQRNGATIDPGVQVPLQAESNGRLVGELPWMACHSDDTNVLNIVVQRAADAQIEWHGSYDLGWEGGSLPIYYLHQGETEPPAPDPEPDDPAFLRKKAEFIAGRQPRFRRVNTAMGAPSDFTLASADDTVRFNLMEPGVTEQMARYIHGLYETDADRLVGMMFFMGQSCMMRTHTAYDPAATARLNPLSMLRFGTGHCGHHTRSMAPFVNRMEIGNTGKYHRARTAMIGGHCVVMVEYRGDYVLLDAKHCCMFYSLDNLDLATLTEMRREPEIVRRAYPHWIMPALMTFDEAYVAAKEPDAFASGGFSYPAGAPVA